MKKFEFASGRAIIIAIYGRAVEAAESERGDVLRELLALLESASGASWAYNDFTGDITPYAPDNDAQRRALWDIVYAYYENKA